MLQPDTISKEVDICILKCKFINDFRINNDRIKKDRGKLFSDENTSQLHHCPICFFSNLNTRCIQYVHHGKYYQCQNCGHVYIQNVPIDIVDYYKDSSYSDTYTQQGNQQLEEIKRASRQKRDWILKYYVYHFFRFPDGILDVGCGAGHFLHTFYRCAGEYLDTYGVEPSLACRRYAHEKYDLDVYAEVDSGIYDLITFMGSLEHVVDPIATLEQYKRMAHEKTAIIIEYPIYDSVSTSIQQLYGDDYINRHLDPLQLHFFSDNSMKLMLSKIGYHIAYQWVYGMDAFEMFNLLFQHCGRPNHIFQHKDDIAKLQRLIDHRKLSDMRMIIAVSQ